MATIAGTPETTPFPRVGISLAAWTDGPVTVTRVHADGTRVAVRSMPDSSGGVSFGYDNETPLGEAFHYEAYSGASLVTSADVTVGRIDTWFSSPGMPQMAYQVDMVAVPAAKKSRPTAVLDGPFRSMPAGEYGERSSARFALQLRADSLAERVAVDQVLQQSGVVLIRIPLTEWTATYAMVTDDDRDPRVSFRRQGTATDTIADQRTFTLTCIETTSPAGGSYGDPTASYQALLDSGRTYQALLDWKGTGATVYLDLLRGGF
jgi:hypothetical protein